MNNNRYMNIIPLVLILLVGYSVWVYFRLPEKKTTPPPNPPPRRSCTVQAAKEYRCQLQQLKTVEDWRAAHLTGREAERDSWLQAKLGYALMRAKDDKALNDQNVRNLLEDTYLTVLRGRHQNAQAVEEIAEEGGARLRTYVSPVDGTVQSYSVSVPGCYDPAISWPLIVSMHGHGWYSQYQGHPAPTYGGAICLSPQGRGSNDYKDLGEDDVLATLKLVQDEFNIDPDRIYLTGGSMGGTGSFHMAVHYADMFAAIFPIVGNADNRAWTERWGWNRIFPGRNNELRDLIQESHTARAFVSNLFNVPSYIISGSADTIVPPAHSRNMVAEMRRLGFNVEYREYPNIGHGGFSWEMQQAGMAWTCGWKRNPYPRTIHWKAAQLKHGKAYWVRMEQFDRPLEIGEIRANAKGSIMLEVTTKNLLSFSFQRPAALFETGRRFVVMVDGQLLSLPPIENEQEWTTLSKDPNHGWRLASDLPLEPLRKKVGCEGPVNEALMNPFVLVVGTQNDEMKAVWQAEAEHFAEEWKRRNLAYPRIVEDTFVDSEMEQNYNLILLGGSSDNLVSSRQVSAIPWGDMSAMLMGTGQTENLMDYPDVGTIVVYPNALNANRLFVVWTANSPSAAYQGWWRFGNWFNWGVFDSKKYFDYAIYDARSCNPETLLLVGWFGSDWQVASGRYYTKVQEVREASADQLYPEYSGKAPERQELSLLDLKPEKIDQMRGAVGFGRTFFGEPLPGSLGLRAPAVMEYDLDGKYTLFKSEVQLLNPRESNMCMTREKGESVKFKVWGDGKSLGEAKVDWKAPVNKLEVKIAGVKKLKLDVQPDGGPSWLHMGSAWINPVVTK